MLPSTQGYLAIGEDHFVPILMLQYLHFVQMKMNFLQGGGEEMIVSFPLDFYRG
jgi:hypothetical protein